MTLVIGDNTYISLADWQGFCTDNFNAVFNDGTQAKQEAALRQAFLYLSGLSWLGTPTGAAAWPRSGVVVNNTVIEGVPQAVINAQSHIAYLVFYDQLNLIQPVKSGIKREKAKAGAVEAETEYQDGFNHTDLLKGLPVIKGYLRPYMQSAYSVRSYRA